MKDEIKVGEYIRTEEGTIVKIEDEEFDLLFSFFEPNILYKHWVSKTDCKLEKIKNHSFNIIDLLEEDDYVNGYMVLKVNREYITLEVYDPYNPHKLWKLRNEEIESVVTKEMFKLVEYEV